MVKTARADDLLNLLKGHVGKGLGVGCNLEKCRGNKVNALVGTLRRQNHRNDKFVRIVEI